MNEGLWCISNGSSINYLTYLQSILEINSQKEDRSARGLDLLVQAIPRTNFCLGPGIHVERFIAPPLALTFAQSRKTISTDTHLVHTIRALHTT